MTMKSNPCEILRRLAAACCIAATLLATSVAAAREVPQILLVNSDAGVEKYRRVETAFRTQIGPAIGRITGITLQQSQPPEIVKKLFRDTKPALVFCIGSKAYQIAQQFGGDTPVLFSSVINWQRFGHQSNHFGVAYELSLAQELSLLHYIFPKLSRIGVLYNPNFNRERVVEAQAYAADIGLTVIDKSVGDSKDLADALETLLPQIDVLWLIADPVVLADRTAVEDIFAAGEKQHKPIYAYSDAYLRFGASLVIAADTPTIGRQAANLAQDLLQHVPPANTVQTPVGSHITLNLCQLGKLQVDYNADALDSVNRILECK